MVPPYSLFPLNKPGKQVSQVALVIKNPPANAGDTRDGSIPGSGRSPGVGNGTRLQYSCLENSMGREAWWATYSPWGCKRGGRDWVNEHTVHTLENTQEEESVNASWESQKWWENIKVEISAQRKAQLYRRWYDFMMLCQGHLFFKRLYINFAKNMPDSVINS